MLSPFDNLEDVIRAEFFPGVDLALRRGQHIGREDGPMYDFLLDALDHLEPLYRRFGAELIHRADGYFYLLPRGDRLRRRKLSAGEMLVGQALALLYLDPSTLQGSGVVRRQALLERLDGLLEMRRLFEILNPRKRKFNERIAARKIRKKVNTALQTLKQLGFVDQLDGDRLRLRPALMRFAEPVRGLEDRARALEQLVATGEVRLEQEDEVGDEDATEGEEQ